MKTLLGKLKKTKSFVLTHSKSSRTVSTLRFFARSGLDFGIFQHTLVVLLVLNLSATSFGADEDPKSFKTDELKDGDWKPVQDKPEVVQEKMYSKVLKLEVTPLYGWVPSDSFEDSQFWGVQTGFHISDSFGIGGGYMKYKNEASALTKQFRDSYGINPEYNTKKDAFYGQIYWTPIYAKLAFLGRKLSHYELYFGGGYGRYSNSGGTRNAFVGSIGNRFFIFSWLNLKLEYLMFRYKDSVRYTTGLERGKEVRRWRTPGNASVGLSFLFF